jgi:hypothetical protein
MASSKLSALGAITSVGSDDLVYVADTADGGSTYASKKVTKANLFSGYATETYVGTQISNLINGAPGALDTLNELAAALGDDGSFSTTITNMINANETHVDNMASLTGVAKDQTGLSTFTGSTISDGATIKAALQDLETAVEGAQAGSAVADRTKTETGSANASHYMTFVADDNTSSTAETVYTDAGVTYNPAANLLTTGEISVTTLDIGGVDVTATAAELNILDGVTSTATELNLLDGCVATTTQLNYLQGVTSGVQTQLDAKTADGDNVNVLVGTTSADSVPQAGGVDNYLFLVVNKADGSIKAIDKTFIEAEG